MRRYLVAVPTYWTFPEPGGQEDIIFDHPSPLGTRGTLRRTLESLVGLASQGVEIAVVAAASAPELELEVERHVKALIDSPPLPYSVRFFTASHLRQLQDFLQREDKGEAVDLLSLAGYAQIRNLALILANLRSAETLISLDDDEVIADPEFLGKIKADFELLENAHPVFGLAGIYLQADGAVLLPEPEAPWAAYWPKLRWLNQALTQLALTGPRLRPTPLGFGGNMVLGAALCRRLPFDPAITRGEDVDYVLNARLFGIPFFMDRDLSIVHLPPEKPHPVWQRLRQDLIRFVYTRLKLRQQEPIPGLTPVTAADLSPYPGNFLQDNLEILAHQSHTLLALEYLAAGDAEAARQTLNNLTLLNRLEQAGTNVFKDYLEVVRQWQALQEWLAVPEIAARARQAIWGSS